MNFEYFADGGEEEVQGLVDGIEFTRKIFDSLPGGADASIAEAVPGQDVNTTEQLSQYVRVEAYGHHAAGTARISGNDDPLAMLDSRFRVRDVEVFV